MADLLFNDMFFYLSRDLTPKYRTQFSQIFRLNGAEEVDLNDPKLTHYVTNSLPGPDSPESPPENSSAVFVTPLWVERSLIFSVVQEPEFFSPDPAMLFSGVVATSSELSSSDNEVLSAGISSLGGQWRSALTKDVTHLFAVTTGTQKYETAMHFKDVTDIKVVVPHWFDDVVRLGVRNIPTDDYEWPEPKLFKAYGVEGLKAAEGDATRAAKRGKVLTPKKKALYETALQESTDLPARPAENSHVWNGLKILLGASLELNESQKTAHRADVERGGGQVLEYASLEEELAMVEEADVYVTRFRSGPVFVKAYRLKKTIGTLPWLWYVRATGTFSRPTDQLLHYPIPLKQIEGFQRHMITVTNYTGKDREYIKKLINAMGAEFTASMSGKNTVVVASCISGTKTAKAASWGIPIVNHLWLEDCFSHWRDISPAQEKYIIFRPGIDLSPVLAEERGLGVGRVGYDQAELDAMEREIEMEVEGVDDGTQRPVKGILKRQSLGNYASMTSIRSTEEVENVVGQFDGDQEMQMGAEGDLSAGAYQDLDVPLDDEGRVSLAGEREEEGQVELDERESRRKVPGTPAKPKPRTPARAGRDTPVRKPVTPTTGKTSSKAKGRSKPVLPIDSDEEEDEDEENDQPPDSPVRPKKKLIRRVTGAPAESSSARVGRRESSIKENVHTTPVRRSDFDDLLGSTTKKGSVVKTYGSRSRSRSRGREAEKAGKGKAKAKASVSEDDDTGMEELEEIRPKTSKQPAKASRRRPVIPSDSEEEELPERGRGRGRANATARVTRSVSRASRSSRRSEVEVVVPTIAQVRSVSRTRESVRSPQEKVKDAAKTKAKDAGKRKSVGKTESVAPKVQDASAKVPAKRGRPAKTKPVESPPPEPQPEEEGQEGEDEDEDEEGTPSPMPPPKKQTKPARRVPPAKAAEPSTPESEAESAPVPPKTKTTPKVTRHTPEPGPSTVAVPESRTKRSAATKATQRLRDEVMPDVVNFQKELKNGNVKSVLDHEREQGTSVKKGKKRASLGDDEHQSADEEPDKKRQKTGAASKKGRKSDVGGEAELVEEAHGRKEAESRTGAVKKSASPEKGANIVVMTTQVNLSDDVMKAFAKLGAKFTTKPSECTHLVTRAIVRTEKLLCAMPVVAHIVTQKWVETCVTKKTILPAESYALRDTENEKKYGFKLADALERARANNGKLFEGKTFYVTPKVPVDIKLLKNVVTAGGGQVVTQVPTVRILKGSTNRVVVSSPADIAIWRPLAENGFAIYTHELILTGMLKQQLEWDSPANKVPDSDIH